MMPREIIAEAWALTKREKSLKRWGFTSSFFETLLNVKLIAYQIYFLHAYMVGHEVGFFDDFIWLYENVPLWLTIVITVIFLILLGIEVIFPNLAKGAIIGLAAKSHKKEKVEGGLVLALYNFFPILGIHEFLVLSSWATTLTLCSVTLRYIPGDAKFAMVAIIVSFFLLSNILKFFFSFAEPAIVIQKAGVFTAMSTSFKMIVSYLSHAMFLFLLLLIISIRTMINAVIVLIIPGIIIGLGFLLTFIFSPLISYIIAGIVGLGFIVAASMLFAYLHVFKETVWAISFMELRKKKDLDLID